MSECRFRSNLEAGWLIGWLADWLIGEICSYNFEDFTFRCVPRYVRVVHIGTDITHVKAQTHGFD